MQPHLTPSERFLSKIDTSGACHLWTGCADPHGYGRLGTRLAHRIAWELAHGPIPPRIVGRDGVEGRTCVLHNCPGGDNPPCVNVAHLWLGTQADNMADMAAKGRSGPKNHPERMPRGTKWADAHAGSMARGSRHGSVTHPERLMRGERWVTAHAGTMVRGERWVAAHAGRVVRGEHHGNAKLTDALVRTIRARAASGEKQHVIAHEFGASESAISAVVRGKTWQHVTASSPTVADAADQD